MKKCSGRAGTGLACTLTLAGLMTFMSGVDAPVRAADAGDANIILDTAIKALGGEEKLGKIKAVSWKGKGTITFGGSDNAITTQTFVQGLDHSRQEFESEFGGQQFKGVTVVANDKGWRRFGEQNMEMDKDAIANERRTAYLMWIPITIVPLKGKEFKVEALPEESVGGKPQAGIKATAPDGKSFNLYFDRESGLPVRLLAKVIGFMGQEFTQETMFSDYQEMSGVKKATKISSKRDGEKFIEAQITEFKVLETVDAKTFAEPM